MLFGQNEGLCVTFVLNDVITIGGTAILVSCRGAGTYMLPFNRSVWRHLSVIVETGRQAQPQRRLTEPTIVQSKSIRTTLLLRS